MTRKVVLGGTIHNDRLTSGHLGQIFELWRTFEVIPVLIVVKQIHLCSYVKYDAVY